MWCKKLGLLALALSPWLSGCASSRSLLGEPVPPGGSELYAASEEEVREAAVAALRAAGLGVDEVLPRQDGQDVLASRGWSLWDYGAIARVSVEPVGDGGDGTWLHVMSRLHMASNLAGKSDYREDILGGVHAALSERLRGPAALPQATLAARVTDPLSVGTPLRLQGRRFYVQELDETSVTLDDGLGPSPRRVTPNDLANMTEVERLLREPYRWGRFFLASALGVGVGYLVGSAYSSDIYGNVGWVYGAAVAATGVGLGVAWGNRGRTQWRLMP